MKKFTLRFDDEQLHQDFKIACIKSDTNMQKELIKMIEKYVEDTKKKNS